jgi:hypothetical protein
MTEHFRCYARQHAQMATGLLGWTPPLFWHATPAEFLTAWRGFCNAYTPHEGDLDGGNESTMQPLTRQELARLLANDAEI